MGVPGQVLPQAGTPPRQATPPPRQVHPLAGTSPGRYTPSRYTPWAGTPWAGTPPLGLVHPPGRYTSQAGNPPQAGSPPGRYTPGRYTPSRYTPWAGTPPLGLVHPPGRYTPRAGTPRQVHHPLGRYTPWATVHAGIGSTSGRYASDWNAFLLCTCVLTLTEHHFTHRNVLRLTLGKPLWGISPSNGTSEVLIKYIAKYIHAAI